ncbi:MAG: DNA helicase, partial [Prevotella shahii]|nr:DNA helicase [Hoylesella shahii]
NEWRAIKAKWFLPRFFAKRTFIKKLKQFNSLIIEQEVDTLLSNLLNYQLLHKEITTIQDAVRTVFAVNLDGENLPSDDALKRYTSSLDNWLKHIDRARDWYQWCAYKKELENEGLGVIAHYIEQVEISAEQLKDAFFKRIFRNIASEKIASSPILRTFEGAIFDETISRYQQLTEEFQLLSQKELYARLASNIPHVTESIDNSSPIGFLNRNIANGGRGISLRDLFDNITTLLPRLCPCMLMSPMSVAQFLTLSQSKFDLVIFDEASQMPTSEAVGAIARGKSVIVVGDPKQMPPTSFFSSTSVGEDEADIDDLDSILDDCHSLGIPSLQLNWHYRSKHESLIAFSNNEYYDGELITFPSIDDQTTKVKYCYVDGVYDKGGRRSNRMEAETIVEDIVKRLQSSNHAKYSIGVIAFSQVQQNLIEDLLTDKLDKDKKLREAADELYEPIFIKNLENVQGDERDIILFSIGYGPDKDGKVSMNFGPLNNNGGEKRLNVAVSRARREMIVYSSLKASQIDLRRTKARGVEGLKHFLEYAEQQILIQTANVRKDSSDRVISEQIAKTLRTRGHIVNTNIGRSNFKVDVAIVDSHDNGNYSMGILLDGEVYHDTQTTRDREIVQPTILNLHGWKIMRVWSVDWINNPERVIARIEHVLNQEHKPTETPVINTTFDVTKEKVEVIERNEKEYKTYQSNLNTASMSDEVLAAKILSCEQPMTLMYLCKCMCHHRDTTRVSPTLLATVSDIVASKMYAQKIGYSTILWTDKE